MKMSVADVKFDERGLVPAVVQDARTHRVLMLAYMNADSLERTLETRETWFWSRSRAELWHKGETSGHAQSVVNVLLDCDGDALTVLVHPNGPACHTGQTSCFHNVIETGMTAEAGDDRPQELGETLSTLYSVVQTRKRHRPQGSYTTYLFDQGLDKILKKVGEESSETIIAAKNGDRDAVVKECSDLLYHLIVLLVECGLRLEEISDELVSRRKEDGTQQC